MRRGEIWAAAGGGGYAGKPRPVVIVQDDRFDATGSVTVCPFTTDPTEAPLLRIPVTADQTNGLSQDSSLMVDKLTATRRSNLHDHLGQLDEEYMLRLGRALVVFLGIAG